jgi:hypothetical protein
MLDIPETNVFAFSGSGARGWMREKASKRLINPLALSALASAESISSS